MTITEPGIYEIPEAEYHADPCPVPSLSASIAKVLLNESPRHAWTAHPRLNPNQELKVKDIFDLGSCAHSLMLGSDSQIEVIEADDWRTKDAKAKRDAARAACNIPVLTKNMVEIEAMVIAAQAQLKVHKDASNAFTDGRPERMAVWQEETAYGPVWCRALVDWLPNDKKADLWDYKTTGTSANPDTFQRQVFELGMDFQASFYARGLRKIGAWDGQHFCFVVQENKPPFALSVIGLGPDALALANRKVDRALAQWAWCLTNDTWAGYPNETAWVNIPVYHELRWSDREAREELQVTTADVNEAEIIFKGLVDWQAPLKEESK